MNPATTTVRMGLPLLLAAAALALAATPRQAARPWPLRPRVEVGQALVRLGDLLAAPHAPTAPAAALQATALSVAPQPGSPLRWSHAQVAARLSALGLQPGDFAIPRAIEIQRSAQALAPAAVQAAVAAYLHRPVAAADLDFAPPLTTVADPGVSVLSSRLDLPHGRVVLICRARNEPRLVPFVVSVRLPADQIDARRRAALLPGAAAAPSAPSSPFLVQPGRLAQWLIARDSYSLTSQVLPLQAGRVGEIIRATSTATHAQVRVQVVGKDEVRSAPLTAAEAFHGH